MNVNHPIAAHRLRDLARESLLAEAVAAHRAALAARVAAGRRRSGLGVRGRLGDVVIALGRWVGGSEAAAGGRPAAASFGPGR